MAGPVQSAATTQITGTGPISATLNGVVAGNLLTIQLSMYLAGGGGGQAAPTAPTNYTPDPNAPTSQAYGGSGEAVLVATYIRSNAPAGTNSPSITVPAGTYAVMTLTEWPAADYPHPVSYDGPACSYGGGNAAPTTSMSVGPGSTPSRAKSLVLATIDADQASGSSNTGLTAATSGYTNLALLNNASNQEQISHDYKELTSAAAQSAGWTQNSYGGTQAWKGSVVVLYGADPPNTDFSVALRDNGAGTFDVKLDADPPVWLAPFRNRSVKVPYYWTKTPPMLVRYANPGLPVLFPATALLLVKVRVSGGTWEEVPLKSRGASDWGDPVVNVRDGSGWVQ